MSTGIIPVNKESIKYIDPKKIKIKIESSSTSGDENEDWLDSRNKKKARFKSDSSSDESISFDSDNK